MRQGFTRVFAILLIAALTSSACGNGSALEETTSTASPVTTSRPTTTTTAPATPIALSDLTGRWESGSNALQFDEGGSYELLDLDADGAATETGVIGFVALQEGQLIFATSANPNPCPGETGVYVGEIHGDVLQLSVVDEPCAFREEAFAAPFEEVSAPLALTDLAGDWENERSVLRINDAGDYVVLGVDADPDRPLTGGFVARDDENFIFVSGVAGECPGQTGVYEAAIDGEILTLSLVDDPCAARAGWFEPPYSRV